MAAPCPHSKPRGDVRLSELTSGSLWRQQRRQQRSCPAAYAEVQGSACSGPLPACLPGALQQAQRGCALADAAVSPPHLMRAGPGNDRGLQIWLRASPEDCHPGPGRGRPALADRLHGCACACHPTGGIACAQPAWLISHALIWHQALASNLHAHPIPRGWTTELATAHMDAQAVRSTYAAACDRAGLGSGSCMALGSSSPNAVRAGLCLHQHADQATCCLLPGPDAANGPASCTVHMVPITCNAELDAGRPGSLQLLSACVRRTRPAMRQLLSRTTLQGDWTLCSCASTRRSTRWAAGATRRARCPGTTAGAPCEGLPPGTRSQVRMLRLIPQHPHLAGLPVHRLLMGPPAGQGLQACLRLHRQGSQAGHGSCGRRRPPCMRGGSSWGSPPVPSAPGSAALWAVCHDHRRRRFASLASTSARQQFSLQAGNPAMLGGSGLSARSAMHLCGSCRTTHLRSV